jgi:hypothetical protein
MAARFLWMRATRAVAVLIVALALGDARAGLDEFPVSCVDANEPIALSYGEHALCSLSQPTDLDVFTFNGSAGDVVRLNLASETLCLDARLEVRDPDGLVITDTYCNGHVGNILYDCLSTCALDSVDLTLAKTGQYGIVVSDAGTDNAGDYAIQIERLPPAITPGLPYNTPVTDTLAPETDVDVLAFQGAAGSIVRLSLESQSLCLDARLEVLDPNGTVISDTACNGHVGNILYDCLYVCAINPVDLTLTATGTYHAVISDAGSNNPGTYQVSVNCIFGNCPSAAPECTPDDTCNDNDACTDDLCDAVAGCSHVQNDRPTCVTTTTTSSSTTSSTSTSSTSTSSSTTTTSLISITSTTSTTGVPTTTTTTLGGECPLAPTFESILCLFDALAGDVSRDEFGRLKTGIEKALNKARAQAQKAATTDNRKVAKTQLKKSAHSLASFAHKLDSRNARKLVPQTTRDMLQADATVIRNEIARLRGTL